MDLTGILDSWPACLQDGKPKKYNNNTHYCLANRIIEIQPQSQTSPLKTTPQMSPLNLTPQMSPLKPTPHTSPLKPTPHTSPLKLTPQTSPLKPTPQTSPLKPTPHTSLLKPTPRTSPLKSTPHTSPLKPTPRTSPVKPTPHTSPLKPTPRTSPVKPTPHTSPLKPTPRTSPLKPTPHTSPLKTTHQTSPLKPTPTQSTVSKRLFTALETASTISTDAEVTNGIECCSMTSIGYKCCEKETSYPNYKICCNNIVYKCCEMDSKQRNLTLIRCQHAVLNDRLWETTINLMMVSMANPICPNGKYEYMLTIGQMVSINNFQFYRGNLTKIENGRPTGFKLHVNVQCNDISPEVSLKSSAFFIKSDYNNIITISSLVLYINLKDLYNVMS